VGQISAGSSDLPKGIRNAFTVRSEIFIRSAISFTSNPRSIHSPPLPAFPLSSPELQWFSHLNLVLSEF
jgi:hypothetical protein